VVPADGAPSPNLADVLLRPKRGGKAERCTWTGDKYEKADETAQ